MSTNKKPIRTGGTRRTKAKPLPAPGMEDFMTRSKANEGHKLPLYTADGRLSAHWIRVRGVDSDAFIRARARQSRKIGEIASLPEEKQEEAIRESTLEMLASLVAEWSFDMPCTPEAIRNFLREAPQIAVEIDKFASRRATFFKMGSGDLTDTPPPSSD